MAAAVSIFDPGHYRNARRPLLEAETLPPWCYTSEEFYQREVEQIFLKTWTFVGRGDEVATPGDFFVLDLFGESVIITRDDDGTVHAFANSCRHRGTRLLCDRGNLHTIRCPYHSWTYGLDGALIGAPAMGKTEGFKRADHGLIAIRLETWAGFIFINFDPEAEPLVQYLGDLPERFAPYAFENMVCVRRKEYALRCNWKIYLENAMEDYHTATVHHQSIGTQKTTVEETRGQWAAIHMPSERTIAVLPEDGTTFPHIPTLAGKPARGTFFTAIYPSTFFATTQDCMWWLQQLPQGATSTRVVIGSCFPRETVAREDFETVVQHYYRRWDTSLPEDNDISERQQAGLASRLSRPGRFCWREPIVHAIDNWVLDRVLEVGAPPSLEQA